jgi:hypothetical protein
LSSFAETGASPKVEQVVKKIGKVLVDIDDNVLQYCSIDKQVGASCLSGIYLELGASTCAGKLQTSVFLTADLVQGSKPKSKQSLGEKEQDFLDALRVSKNGRRRRNRS